MAKIIIGMGLPGAGKSHILQQFSEKYGYEYLSVDNVRDMFNLAANEPSTEREWDFLRMQTLEKYREGKTVVVDGTFLGDIRKKFINFIRENGVEKIQGVLVDTPEEIAWARNLTRERNTSREVFDDRLLNLEKLPPEISDGFDALFSVNENGELTKASQIDEQTREFKPKHRFL